MKKSTRKSTKNVFFVQFSLVFIAFFVGYSETKAVNTSRPYINTSDIDLFWTAYTRLSSATSHNDSLDTMQKYYLNIASAEMKKFARSRGFTAKEYVYTIAAHPRFWKSLKAQTDKIDSIGRQINALFDTLEKRMPGFKKPRVCFTIGCLRSGGTTFGKTVLIGSEIAAANDLVDKSELSAWLQNATPKNGNILAMVIHEAIHTQQKNIAWLDFFAMARHRRFKLMNAAIVEGGADFLTDKFLNLNINAHLQEYGNANLCNLVKEFEATASQSPFDYSAWLYNGLSSKKRPADLAYFIGYKFCEGYYNNSKNKEKALRKILNRGKYKTVYRRSGYKNKKCA